MNYVPYTYLLTFTHPYTQKREYYYGVQYGRSAHPTNLGNTYFSSSSSVKYRIKKYGWSCFMFEIRKIFSNEHSAKTWEHKVLRRMNVVEKKEWLNRNDCYGPPVGGGENNPFYGRKHSEKTKKHMSTKKKKWFSIEENRQKTIDAQQNRDNSAFRTVEFRTKRSIFLKECYANGYMIPASNYGENNGMYGKTHTEQSKQLMSEAKKDKYAGENNPMYGKTHSDETKEKMRQSRIGKKHTEEHKQRMIEISKNNYTEVNAKALEKAQELRKKKVCIDNKIYNSVTEAISDIGVSKSHFYRMIKSGKLTYEEVGE